jgi:hypothetical protein
VREGWPGHRASITEQHQRGEEAGQRRPEAEPTVWTARMLATLASGG